MRTIRQAGLALAFLASGLAGCAAYVNIPPEQGDVADHDATGEYADGAMALGAHAAIADDPITRPFLLVLPKGASTDTYNFVIPKVSPQATWLGPEPAGPTTAPAKGGGVMLLPPTPTTLPADRAVVEVRQVRVRAWRAEVDVVRPMDLDQPEGPKQVATVYLKWDPVSHWQVVQTRIWHESVDTALRKAPYAGGPELTR